METDTGRLWWKDDCPTNAVMCNAEEGFYGCTRPAGHEGPHVACTPVKDPTGTYYDVAAIWEGGN